MEDGSRRVPFRQRSGKLEARCLNTSFTPPRIVASREEELDDEAWKLLMERPEYKMAQGIHVANCSALLDITACAACSDIEWLYLHSVGTTPVIAPFGGCRRLPKNGPVQIPLLLRFEKLESLSLINMNLRDLSALTGARVKTVFLASIRAATDFEVFGTMPDLEVLDVRGVSFTDEHLMELVESATIERIELMSTQVSQDGVERFLDQRGVLGLSRPWIHLYGRTERPVVEQPDLISV